MVSTKRQIILPDLVYLHHRVVWMDDALPGFSDRGNSTYVYFGPYLQIISRKPTWKSQNLRSPWSGDDVGPDLHCPPEPQLNVTQSELLEWVMILSPDDHYQGGHLLLLQRLVLQLPRGLPLWWLPLLRVGGGWVICGMKPIAHLGFFPFSAQKLLPEQLPLEDDNSDFTLQGYQNFLIEPMVIYIFINPIPIMFEYTLTYIQSFS